MLSASQDTTLILWDLKGNLLHTFTGHTDKVSFILLNISSLKYISGNILLFFLRWKEICLVLKRQDGENMEHRDSARDTAVSTFRLCTSVIYLFRPKDPHFILGIGLLCVS